MADNRFIATESDVYFPQDDILCRTCSFRDKQFASSYKDFVCAKYPGENDDDSDSKPMEIVCKGANCKFYKKG